MADGRCNPKRVRLFGYFGHNLPFRWLSVSKTTRHPYFPWYPAIESPGVAEKDLEPGQRVGGSVWMSSMMMVGSCIILNCCNSKIAKCFMLSPEHECVLLFSALADCPFNRSTITCFSRSTLQVFQEEVPRAKARQQLREAQNNDASRGLGEETGLRGVKIQGPPNPLMGPPVQCGYSKLQWIERMMAIFCGMEV